MIGATGPADDTFGGVGFDDDSAGDHDALGFGWPEEDSIELAQAARKVNRMEINYSRAAKQVDVRALKQLLWDNIDKLAGDSNEVWHLCASTCEWLWQWIVCVAG